MRSLCRCVLLVAMVLLFSRAALAAEAGDGVLVATYTPGAHRVLMFWTADAALQCYTARTNDLEDFRRACLGVLAAPVNSTVVKRLSPLRGTFVKVRLLEGDDEGRIGWVLRTEFMDTGGGQ